ncbi:pyocin knob domain-containing protein [Escherichia coli]|uniref:pyocin knob domain-containing protein n=1 Tax=Escherichia coli TaxID=562 RepID=UPI001627A74E|nr:pyocin knob domain-containing protein [Escherichia coli]
MADQIFTGSGFKLFYNDDTANRIPDNAGNELVNELAAMPSFGIDSQVQTIEVYNSEFSEKLLAEQNVNDIDIVVNYVPDCTAHAFLDQATEEQTEFQLTLQYAVTDGIISYSMVNGMISSARLAGDKDSVVTKSYTFTPTDVLVRDGQAPLSTGLVVGSYGVGSNGVEDVPQYEPQLPNGNSFIKVPAARNDNPASADLMGIGLIDSGTFSSIAMTKSGTLAIYAKNQNTAWTRILTATQISDQYVPITRKINGKALNADITITKADVGLSNVTNDAQLKAASNLSDLTDVAAAKTVLGIKGAANFDIIPITNGGTGATTAAAARTNLGLGTAATYNIGTSGSTVPLLSGGNNTWSGTNDFNYATFKSTAATPLKISSNNPTMMFEDANSPNYKTVLVLDGETFRIHEEGTSGPVILNYNYLNKTTTFTKLALSNALEVGQGGTGARLPEDARTNLGAFYENKVTLNTEDLNTINGNMAGVYKQQLSANATTARNYPVQFAGSLRVYQTGANGNSSCVQEYTTFHEGRQYTRICNNATWTAWKESYNADSVIPIANGGTGANTVAAARTNLQINRLTQGASYTDLMSNNNTTRLRVQDNNAWGGSDGTNWIALGLGQGGTGATTAAAARVNLALDRLVQIAGDQTRLYAGDGKTYFEVGNGSRAWGVYDGNTSTWKPLDIAQGGTGATNVAGIKTNLGLDVFVSGGTQTIIQSPNKTNYMYVNDSGVWGGYSSSGPLALGIGQGGTGALNITDARANLQVFQEAYNALTSSDNLNSYDGNNTGFFRNPANANATTANNYPIAQAGTLRVNSTLGGSQAQTCVQEYHAYAANIRYTRCRTDTVWTDWKQVTTSAVSDATVKTISGDLDTKIALSNINKMEFKDFTFNDTPDKARRGVISQQIKTIDPQYVNKVGDLYHLDQTPMLLDGLAAIQELSKENDSLKAQITDQQLQLDELRAVVTQLLIAQNK